MNPTRLTLLALALLGIAALRPDSPAVAQGPENAVRADALGDPLPAHALARLGTVRGRHGSPVYHVGFLNDSKELLTASQDGFFHVWDVASGKELRHFGDGNERLVPAGVANVAIRGVANGPRIAVALSADGTMLASAPVNGDTIHLWDTSSGKATQSIKTERNGAIVLLFLPDGKGLLAQAGNGALREYETATGKELRQLAAPRPQGQPRFGIGGLALSPDGKVLAESRGELQNNTLVSSVLLMDVATGKELRTLKLSDFVNGTPTFSADSRRLALALNAGTVSVFEVATGQEAFKTARLRPRSTVSAIAFTPDGKTFAVKDTEQAVLLCDSATGKELRQLAAPVSATQNAAGVVIINGRNSVVPHELAISPDGKLLAMGGTGNTARVWDLATGKELLPATGHQGAVQSLLVNADGKAVTTRGADNTVRLWDLASGKEQARFALPEGTLTAVVAPDGKTVAVQQVDRSIRVCELATGKELHKLTFPEAPNPFGIGGQTSLAFSPDGKVLAARGLEPTLHLWETATGKVLRTIPEEVPEQPAQPGVFLIRGIAGAAALTFSPDGALVATTTSPNVFVRGAQAPLKSLVRLYHLRTGKLAARCEVPQSVTTLAFSPDGRTIATLNMDRTVSVWELTTGKERGQFRGPSVALAFAPDGRSLATAGADRSVHLWDVAEGKELGAFTGHLGDVLQVAFSTDSHRVISGSSDTAALVWDAAALRKEAAPAGELDVQQVEALWTDLAGLDAVKAHRAIVTLGRSPKQALPWLGEHLKPAAGVEAKRLEALLADLGNDTFAVRQKAAEELEKLGELAEPALVRVLASQPTLEIRQRVERLLDRLVGGKSAPPAETLRALRGIEVLEQIGTPEARQLIEKLTAGAEGARLTRDARSALERLNRTR